MNNEEIRIMELHGKGYCCTQIMLMLMLENMQRENPDLIRAMQGLCMGGGDCSGTCGILTGGLCALSMLLGKGTDFDESHEQLPMLQEMFRDWFVTKVHAMHAGIRCEDILGPGCTGPNPLECGSLLSEAYVKLIEILQENSIDPTEGKESNGF